MKFRRPGPVEFSSKFYTFAFAEVAEELRWVARVCVRTFERQEIRPGSDHLCGKIRGECTRVLCNHVRGNSRRR